MAHSLSFEGRITSGELGCSLAGLGGALSQGEASGGGIVSRTVWLGDGASCEIDLSELLENTHQVSYKYPWVRVKLVMVKQPEQICSRPFKLSARDQTNPPTTLLLKTKLIQPNRIFGPK